MFIATGQDAANVAESHAGMNYIELLDNGDLYWSTTLPALICATYGGGTGLPTQRECLEMLGCYGAGKADKFAEIVAAVDDPDPAVRRAAIENLPAAGAAGSARAVPSARSTSSPVKGETACTGRRMSCVPVCIWQST